MSESQLYSSFRQTTNKQGLEYHQPKENKPQTKKLQTHSDYEVRNSSRKYTPRHHQYDTKSKYSVCNTNRYQAQLRNYEQLQHLLEEQNTFLKQSNKMLQIKIKALENDNLKYKKLYQQKCEQLQISENQKIVFFNEKEEIKKIFFKEMENIQRKYKISQGSDTEVRKQIEKLKLQQGNNSKEQNVFQKQGYVPTTQAQPYVSQEADNSYENTQKTEKITRNGNMASDYIESMLYEEKQQKYESHPPRKEYFRKNNL